MTVGGQSHIFTSRRRAEGPWRAGDGRYAVRDRLGQQDLHRDSGGLRPSARQVVARRSSGPALRSAAIDRAPLLHLGTYAAGGLPLQLPGTVRTAADMTAYMKAWTPAAAPGAQRSYSNPSLGLSRF